MAVVGYSGRLMVPLYTAAAVQTDIWPVFASQSGVPEPENIKKNLDRAIALISRSAAWNPSKIYLLPEFFLTGAAGIGHSEKATELMSVRFPGPEIQRLCELAKQLDAYIAGMAWEIMDDWPGRYWNTAFICSPDAEVILKYHKHYDPTGKTKPGDVLDEYVDRFGEQSLFPVVDTPIGRLGCLTCYDINFPEMARCLALNGAEILLHPTSEGRAPFLLEDQGGWEIGKRSRAYENLAYVISANQGRFLGSDFPTHRMRGRSQIIDFHGRVVTLAETSGETILQADIEIERLRQKRGQMQMNFLAQLQTHIHAPVYARHQRWPANLWADTPPPNNMANVKAGLEIVEKLQSEDHFVPPAGSTLTKKSFV
jgi:predicted amidohydrolase